MNTKYARQHGNDRMQFSKFLIKKKPLARQGCILKRQVCLHQSAHLSTVFYSLKYERVFLCLQILTLYQTKNSHTGPNRKHLQTTKQM